MAEKEYWKIILTFTFPHEAHLAKTYLESEGIECFIKDELTAQINIYSNAVGGAKLLVRETEYEQGIELLIKGGFIHEPDKKAEPVEIILVDRHFDKTTCPYCKSENISIKKVPHIWSVIVIFIFGAVFPIFKKSFKCYDCEKEWKLVQKKQFITY